jgi:hypothetical protein
MSRRTRNTNEKARWHGDLSVEEAESVAVLGGVVLVALGLVVVLLLLAAALAPTALAAGPRVQRGLERALLGVVVQCVP